VPDALNGAFPIVPYADARAGIAWLERAFGADATAVYPPETDQILVHAEVRVGIGIVMPADTRRAAERPCARADRPGLRIARVRRPGPGRQPLELRHLPAVGRVGPRYQVSHRANLSRGSRGPGRKSVPTVWATGISATWENSS
jgi:hypothetical protein